ncbi:MAG: class C sortase [Clostridiales bacterium]|nr:class C sortase [Clostridiales bacterium]
MSKKQTGQAQDSPEQAAQPAEKQHHRIKDRLPLLFIFLILAAGVAIMGYPVLSNWICEYTASVEIASYNAVLEEQDTSDLDAMLEAASEYNASLSGSGDSDSAADYEDLLALTDAIGYIEIPKIGVYLPIYHGVDDEVLQKGIGHMPETSLPVGGESTHAVLSGHTGLPAAKLFTDLDQLEEGDMFYIHVLNRILAYEVDQIKVVLPDETDDIRIVEGEDYVTLLTCTPYGVNSHRLLVRGTRVEYSPAVVEVQTPADTETKQKIPVEKILWYGAVAAGAVLLLIILLILLLPGRRKKRK